MDASNACTDAKEVELTEEHAATAETKSSTGRNGRNKTLPKMAEKAAKAFVLSSHHKTGSILTEQIYDILKGALKETEKSLEAHSFLRNFNRSQPIPNFGKRCHNTTICLYRLSCSLAHDISVLDSYFGVDGYRFVHVARDPLSLLLSAYQYHMESSDCWNACPNLGEMRRAPVQIGLKMQAQKLLKTTIAEQYALAKLVCNSSVRGANILLGDFNEEFDGTVKRLLDALLGDRVGEAVKEGVRENAKRLDVGRWSNEKRQANRHVHTGSTGEKMALDTWRNHSAELEPEWTEIEAARKALFELLDSC